MIPTFPDFKKLEWDDREEFERYSSWLAPHSDFNFVTVWAWNVNEPMRLSKLNDNLVIFFNDYVTGEQFLSFVGKNRITETALELIRFSKNNYGVPILKYVPEEIAKDIVDSRLIVTVDEDNCDYVSSVSDFADSDKLTRSHGSVGQKCRLFLKHYPAFQIKVCSLDEADKHESTGLFLKWAAHKQLNIADLVEYKAFEKYIRLKETNIKVLSIYVDGILAGFQMMEIISKGYAILEFVKGDVAYKGIFQFLMWQACQYLKKAGIRYLNLQVDCGCDELKSSKVKNYQPELFLRRYLVKSTETDKALNEPVIL